MDEYREGDWNSPGYKNANEVVCPNGGIYYRKNVLHKDKTSWFEFEWSLEKQEMQCWLMKNEKGEDKVFMHKWPLKGNVPNWLMFTCGWDEQAIVTTYIINGNPSD